ncbi:MAG: acyl-CoA dehydrogenase [Alphaproteobacteria bacterium]|nr:acyl-CoA dehydrogenase [Alphaproteobacteria bacterium]
MTAPASPTVLSSRRDTAAGDWLGRAELDALTPAALTERTTALKPLLAAHAREAEAFRHPADAAWNAIRRTGAFYHLVPRRYGGLEFGVDAFIDAMLPLGEACASTGWVAAFCVEHNWMLAQFPKEAQDEIFGASPYIIAPGVTTPPGRATRVTGGYRLTGQWKWGTGVMHADWVLAAGLVFTDGAPPAMLFFAVPIAEVSILDTWHVDGMIGTGSNDIAIRDVFVPGHRTLDMALMRDGASPGAALHDNPIYRMPMLPFLSLTAAIPALGTARAAVACFRDRLSQRPVFGSDLKQADKPAAQMRLAMADMQARTAEMLVRDVGRKVVALGEQRKAHLVDERIALRLQVAYAVDLCRSAVRLVSEASGAGAHFTDNPLQRALRDINVMASHIVYDLDAATEAHGRALIGLPPTSTLV